MNIVVFESKPRDKKYFSKALKEHTLTFVNEPLHEGNVKKYKNAHCVCTFIFSKVTKNVISQLPKLRLISTRSTGFDHIDVREAKKKNITVCTVPQYGENTIAEHTFALMLNLSRHVHKSYVRALNDNFDISDLTGFDLKGKWLGVVGAGHIGQHVIKIAKGFGMHVIAFDIHRDEFLADLLHFEYAKTIDEVCNKADILTLHVPANPHTRHLINENRLKLMKKGSILINTSRGEIVDTKALYQALLNKRLGGAGLDVIEGEQMVGQDDRELLHQHDVHQLRKLMRAKDILKMDNVVFTPHNAFNSFEALDRILEVTSQNIKNFIVGTSSNVVA